MKHQLTPREKQAIIEKAEEWASRLYETRATGFFNLELSDAQTGRYVVDLSLEGCERWISLEIQLKHGRIFIPGGALITGRGSLAQIHRRFS